MTRYLVSRHPGVREWLRRQGIRCDCHLDHLVKQSLRPGDQVIGTLPLQLASWVCEQGAEYWHLSLQVPLEWRGQELSADQMEACQARLEPFLVQRGPAGHAS